MIYIFIFFSVFLVCSFSKIIWDEFIKYQYEKFRIENYSSYVTILDYNMKKAYEIIYKDRILIYSLEAMKIDDVQFKGASKAFIKLSLDMIGDTVVKYLIDLYGSDQKLYFIMAEYFNNRFEEDEIRKDSQKNLMDREDI